MLCGKEPTGPPLRVCLETSDNMYRPSSNYSPPGASQQLSAITAENNRAAGMRRDAVMVHIPILPHVRSYRDKCMGPSVDIEIQPVLVVAVVLVSMLSHHHQLVHYSHAAPTPLDTPVRTDRLAFSALEVPPLSMICIHIQADNSHYDRPIISLGREVSSIIHTTIEQQK
ncbi:hypothetical protein BDD12DRAFT_85843 [Trichophaea hybrida]|nr:hypothetical protein BDD12DRAFT_85843 [Trichophaea hybrida]